MSSPYPARHTAIGTLQAFAAEALLLPTGLVTAAYLTRHLGPEAYGLFALASTLVARLAWTSTSMLARATIKLVSEATDWRPVGTTAVRVHITTGASFAALLWLGAEPLASLFSERELATFFKLFSVQLLFYIIGKGYLGVLIGLGRFRERALATAAHWVARMVFIVALVEAGLSVDGAILGCALGSAVELAICRYYARPPIMTASPFPAKRLLTYAAPLMLFSLFISLFHKLDLFALKALGGSAAAAGFYAAAQNLSVIPGLFAFALCPHLLSTLSRLCRDGQEPSARSMGEDAHRVVFWMFPFAAMTAGASGEIVRLFFGEEFAAAAPFLSLLIFSEVFVVLISVSTVILVAAERPRWTTWLGAAMLGCALVAHIVVIPAHGALGAATVTTVVSGVGALAGLVAACRRWGVWPPLKTVLRSALLSAAAYAAASLLPSPGAWVIPKVALIIIAIPAGFFLLGEVKEIRRLSIPGLVRQFVFSGGEP